MTSCDRRLAGKVIFPALPDDAFGISQKAGQKAKKRDFAPGVDKNPSIDAGSSSTAVALTL